MTCQSSKMTFGREDTRRRISSVRDSGAKRPSAQSPEVQSSGPRLSQSDPVFGGGNNEYRSRHDGHLFEASQLLIEMQDLLLKL